jgi:diguanylate cyclase (GGDEF)-like protein
LEPGESGYRELGEKSENPPGAWRRAPEGEKFGRIASDPLRGNLFSIYEPVRGSDGSVKGYVAVDFSERELLRERMSHLALLSAVTLSVTTGFCSLYLFVVRKSIVAPINKLTQAADEFLANGERYWKSDSSSISAMEICTGDELQRLCEAMKSVDGKIREYLRDLNMVRERADTDNLTLLHNRDSFQRKVDQYLGGEREESQMDAFMMIDIDFFKVVNDSYGHVVGDEVLIKCAQALRNVLRDTDVVARHGGDEFVVFCKGIGSQSVAENKARQISEAWGNIRPDDGVRPVTASIGIAFSPRDGTTFRELYNNADVALYRAKHGGRDRYVLFENREIAKTG